MNKLFQLIFALLLPLSMMSQNVNVTGQIVGNQGESLPYASVVFRNLTDSLGLFGALCDENGIFAIEVPRENYVVEISFVGMETKFIDVSLEASEGDKDMGVIEISTDILLDEIVVSGNRKAFKIDLDKKVYNVSQDVVARGGTLSDVMSNLPSVQVESDGNVSIRGDQNVRILIDGRPSGMASSAELFSTIPASTIDKIEVITSPSSKYASQGTAGIINVILKKGQKNRLSNSLEVFTGYRLTAGINGNISKNDENASWYINAGLGYSEPQAVNDIFLQRADVIPNISLQESDRIRKQNYYLLNFGGSRILSDRNTITASLTYRGAKSMNDNRTFYKDFSNEVLLEESNRAEIEDESSSFVYGNLSYDHNFSNEGHAFSATISGELTSGSEGGVINSRETFPDARMISIDNTLNEDEVRRYVFSLDYTLPIGKIMMEFGYRADLASIENNFSVEREIDGFTVVIPEVTDMASYNENVHGFYGQVSTSFQKLSLKLGLRTEVSDINIASEGENFMDDKNYTNLLPSVFINYTIDDKNQLQFSGTRRINRPSSWMILPFSTFTDERNMFVGNSDINPSYRNSLELGYSGRFSDKLGLFPTLYYRKTTDEMEFFVEKQILTVGNVEQEIFASTIANIGDYTAYGTEIGFSYDPVKWWNMYMEVGVNGFKQRGSFRGASFDGDGVLFTGAYNSTFVLFKSLRLQLQNFYRGPIETGQYRRRGFYGMNLGLTTNLLKGNGSISFNIRDVFNSTKRLVTTFGDDFTRDLELQYRVRQITLALTYRFNQKQYSGKKGNQYDDFEIIN